MKTFEELKEELLTRAKNAGACQSGYAMGHESRPSKSRERSEVRTASL